MLKKTHYDWRRYWVPREGTIPTGSDGFPMDPESQFAKHSPIRLESFDEISDTPCLALLGEPGIGKSDVVARIVAARSSLPGTDAPELFFLDLRSYSSEDRLHRAIFQSPEFLRWINGTHILEIFLDSLDECLIHNRTVATMLVDEIKNYPRSRLRLRIACRTGEWPTILTDELPKLWSPDAYRAYELAPLLRLNIELALGLRSIEEAPFFEGLRVNNLNALAMKPLTLEFLMDTWNGNSFPKNITELYARGCLALCREQNTNRRVVEKAPLTEGQCLALAERIAVTMILGKRAIISQGNSPVDDELALESISGGIEPTPNDPVSGTSDNLREVVERTGLFSGRANDRMGWSHWSFAEFLAARYLATRGISVTQIRSLIFHPERQLSVVPRVIPQLREMVGWLCALRPEIISDVIRGDPDLLLRSTGAVLDAPFRLQLVASLLNLAEQGRLQAIEWFSRRNYGVLAAPGLAALLKEYLNDITKDIYAREIAFDIVEECHVQELLPDVANVASNSSEVIRIRVAAAHCLTAFPVDAYVSQLRQLLALPKADDPDDDLKGISLRALWPTYLTAKELFSFLSEQRSPNRYGAYSSFLHLKLQDTIQPQDLHTALQWAKSLDSDRNLSLNCQTLAAQVITLACANLAYPGVLAELADLISVRLKRQDSGMPSRFGSKEEPEPWANNVGVRRQLLGVIVPLLEVKTYAREYFAVNLRTLFNREDLGWFIDRVVESGTAEARLHWIAAVYDVLDWSSSNQVDEIISGMARSSFLQERFNECFQIVEIESAEGRKMKANYLRANRWSRAKPDSVPRLSEPLETIIKKRIDAAENGDIDAWWLLNLEMTIRGDVAEYHLEDEFKADITELSGWQILGQADKDRCVRIAATYLDKADPKNETWLGTNVFHRPAIAGYKALRLLESLSPDTFASLPPRVWQKWAAIVVQYPDAESSSGIENAARLLRYAYMVAPVQVIEALTIVMKAEDKSHSHLFVARRMRDCWDHALVSAMISFLKTSPMKPQSVGDVLGELLEYCPAGASAAMEMLADELFNSKEGRERAAAITHALLENVPDQAWHRVWSLMEKDLEFGKSVIERLATSHDERYQGKIAFGLKEREVADLYIWLQRQFPYSEDPKPQGMHRVDERESVAMFRDNILRRLQSRGTTASYEAVEFIIASLPEIKWLKNIRPIAAEATMKETWLGQPVRAILSLANHPEKRIVENGAQLLEVVIESLERLEQKLQGTTPAAFYLWDERDKAPKKENRLSDFVKSHLEEDLKAIGIVANREVEIRDGVGSSGEEGDILVQALSRLGASSHTISVLIETKGCWNPELETAMKSQLRDRYLKDNQCRDGLYLVGWFLCSFWRDSDYRKKATPDWSLIEARKCFADQATKLSSSDLSLKSFVLNVTVR